MILMSLGTGGGPGGGVPGAVSHPPFCAHRRLTKWPQWGTMAMMQTVVETRHYAARAEKFLSESERDALIDFVAFAPLRGDVLVGTGGIRKVRFARGGRGKSGGVRVIYYLYTTEKADLPA